MMKVRWRRSPWGAHIEAPTLTRLLCVQNWRPVHWQRADRRVAVHCAAHCVRAHGRTSAQSERVRLQFNHTFCCDIGCEFTIVPLVSWQARDACRRAAIVCRLGAAPSAASPLPESQPQALVIALLAELARSPNLLLLLQPLLSPSLRSSNPSQSQSLSPRPSQRRRPMRATPAA